MSDYQYPKDIYTEAEPDVNTLANLGPLRAMAGVWEGKRGLDINPKEEGPVKDPYIEHIELQPIDAQTNGPQLFYGLRYHTHIVEPDGVETFHDQVGYWLWEPATKRILFTLSIPRGQTLMAEGTAEPDAKTFTVKAVRGSMTNGIVSNPFIEQAFRTDSYEITVKINDDGTWSYDQTTLMVIPGYDEPFEHRDRNRLTKIAEPTLNPTALAAQQEEKAGKPILFYAAECPDTPPFVAELKRLGVEYKAVEVLSSIPNFKQFMRLRDRHPAFGPMKAKGYAGFPALLLDNDQVILDVETLTKIFKK